MFNGLPRIIITLFLVCSLGSLSNGSECSHPSGCPYFCCVNRLGFDYCCDFEEYAKDHGIEYVIPVVSGIVIAILAGCFICCLCCPCCMLYKRRHRGTVYGRIQLPNQPVPQQVTTVNMMPPQGNMPNSMPMPMPMTQAAPTGMTAPGVPYPVYPGPAAYPAGTAAYPAGTVAYTGQPQMAPPPYSVAVTNDAYVKQAPFNPNYSNN